MKIFLTGGTGLLGRAFVSLFEQRDMSFVAPSSRDLDLLDFPAVKNFINQEQPDWIIHCAAYTQVDKAETERDRCWDLNVKILENLLTYGLPIVHFSTDYVFNAPLCEVNESGDQTFLTIPPDYDREPINYYGESKAAAELLLESYDQPWYNIRSTWLYGKGGDGFPSKIKEQVKAQRPLRVVNDQYGRKTLNTDLAKFVLDGLSPGSSEPGLVPGHHHYQSPGPVHTWHSWAQEIVPEGIEVEAVRTVDLNLPAKRPSNSILV